MPLPLIRLAISPVNGTVHYGVVDTARTITVTGCGTHSPDLLPVGEITAHTLCSACARVLLVLVTQPHPGGEPEARSSAGRGAGASHHRPVPGHLLGYCGKPLEADPTTVTGRWPCRLCTRLGDAIDRLREHAGGLLPDPEPCHGDDTLLWAPGGRENLVVGHRRNSTTGKGFCERPLSSSNPGAPNECAPCRLHWTQAQDVRKRYTLPMMRAEAGAWSAEAVTVF
ncbi:hypothetical protein [Streptomyces sp. NPDC088789]|uniref:hypothetical protein n=1 Tax=Streptomyces sp. NPDC088789 TaxID=3365899 RepID=UPI0038153EEF